MPTLRQHVTRLLESALDGPVAPDATLTVAALREVIDRGTEIERAVQRCRSKPALHTIVSQYQLLAWVEQLRQYRRDLPPSYYRIPNTDVHIGDLRAYMIQLERMARALIDDLRYIEHYTVGDIRRHVAEYATPLDLPVESFTA